MKKKLSVLLLGVVFCGTMMASSSVSANRKVNIEEEEPEGLVCTVRDENGDIIGRCWLCNCAKFADALVE